MCVFSPNRKPQDGKRSKGQKGEGAYFAVNDVEDVTIKYLCMSKRSLWQKNENELTRGT